MIASSMIFDPAQEKFSVCSMGLRHLPAVVDIEQHSFTIKAQSWNKEEFIQYLKEHCSTALVAEDTRGMVAGFLIYESCGDQAGLVNLAVHRACRRQGVARLLIKEFRSMVDPRKKTVALIPCSMKSMESFFKHHQLAVQLVSVKGDAPEVLQPDALQARNAFV